MRGAPMHGVLIVDKDKGPTSHDVVACARRALGTRAVGHAGTLDPMATGVLVLAVGEATKLVAYLTAEDKAYEATIRFGMETDTLDADGEARSRAPFPEPFELEAMRTAARAFVGERDQVPPVVSAIKVDGVAMHKRARRGEQVVPEARRVTLRAVEVAAVRAEVGEIDVALACAKGFYVRAFARDLAASLGSVAHLTALRRTRSGCFEVAGALSSREIIDASRGDVAAKARVRAALRSIDEVAGLLFPHAILDEASTADALHGRRTALPPTFAALEAGAMVALFDRSGALIAIASVDGDGLRIVRGFRSEARPGA